MIAMLLLACQSEIIDKSSPVSQEAAAEDSAVILPEQPVRIVAFGDVHGDIDAALQALKMAQVIDENNQWIGGTTQVVQVGDQLDRGDGERQILDLFEGLRLQATDAGGAFHPLLGNHEVMNVELDFRYVTDGGFAAFQDIPYDENDPFITSFPPEQRGRAEAFRPGGVYANILSEHKVVLQLDDILFVHGGVLPHHVDHGIDLLNTETSAWMRGEGPPSAVMEASESPIWSRHYSRDTDEDDCALLEVVLNQTGAQKMVVAHTVQDEINATCMEQVWRVDVGLAAHYGGSPQVLELLDGNITILSQ